MRLGSPRAARGGTRRESSAAATGSPATSWLPRWTPPRRHRRRPIREPSVVSAAGKVASRRRAARVTSGAAQGCVCGELRAICRQQRAAFAEPPTLQAQLRHYPQLIPAGDDVSSYPGVTGAARGRDVRGACPCGLSRYRGCAGDEEVGRDGRVAPSSPPVPSTRSSRQPSPRGRVTPAGRASGASARHGRKAGDATRRWRVAPEASDASGGRVQGLGAVSSNCNPNGYIGELDARGG